MSKKVSISVTKKGKEFFAKAPWNQSKKKASFKKKVLNVMRPERKYLTTTIQNDQSGSTGSVTHLTAIAQGDSNVLRDGNKVRLQSVLIRMYQRVDTDNTFGDFYRIILLRDTQQVAGTSPTIAQILDSTADVNSPLNGNSGNRFKIIKDWYGSLSGSVVPTAGGGGLTGNGVKTHKLFKKLDTMVQFNGTAGSDIQKNGLYLVILHQHNTSGQFTATYATVRLRYIDN